MAFFKSKGVSIAGMATAVPKKKINVEDYIEFYNQDNVITLYTYGKAVDSKILDKIADSAKYTEK